MGNICNSIIHDYKIGSTFLNKSFYTIYGITYTTTDINKSLILIDLLQSYKHNYCVSISCNLSVLSVNFSFELDKDEEYKCDDPAGNLYYTNDINFIPNMEIIIADKLNERDYKDKEKHIIHEIRDIIEQAGFLSDEIKYILFVSSFPKGNMIIKQELISMDYKKIISYHSDKNDLLYTPLNILDNKFNL